MEGVSQAKKRRSRAARSSESDDGKKRGRPRVDKNDESAAERRRTQIRMAQRAYRQRKESNLDDLRKRVSDLTSTMELMNKAFVDCRVRLSASGLNDSQLLQMQETSMQYETLMRNARNTSEEASDLPTLEAHDVVPTVDQSVQPENISAWMNEPEPRPTQRQTRGDQINGNYALLQDDSVVNNHLSANLDTFDVEQVGQSLVPLANSRKVLAHDTFGRLRVDERPIMHIPAHLPLPTTYSFQETTFARRLHRGCVESAYQLLLDPKRQPGKYERVFRLSLMSRDREKLIASMKAVLARGPHEPLDMSEAPLLHVGGAGTHYPKRDYFGNLLPKKPSYDLGVVRPQTLALLETAARDNLTLDMTVSIAGFEGEWFDPDDVEGYLAEKGVQIDPASSFAEAEISDLPSSSSDASTGSGAPSPQTPPRWQSTSSSAPFDAGRIRELDQLNASITDFALPPLKATTGIASSDALFESRVDFCPPAHATRSLDPRARASSLQGTIWEGSHPSAYLSNDLHAPDNAFDRFSRISPPRPRTRSVLIDVNKFLKGLTISATCIGRTPGFRRHDVDRALATAAFDAF